MVASDATSPVAPSPTAADSSPQATAAPHAAQSDHAAVKQTMADRYGTTDPRKGKRAMWALIIVLCLIGGIVMVIISTGYFSPSAHPERVGFDVIDNSAVEVTFDVTKPEDATARCTLEALTEGHSQVGLKEVVIPPSDHHTVRVTETIATTELATTGVVRECNLVD